MPQDKASQFEQTGQILNGTYYGGSVVIFTCKRCGALVLGDSREQHLAWHLLLRSDFLTIGNWADPGEV